VKFLLGAILGFVAFCPEANADRWSSLNDRVAALEASQQALVKKQEEMVQPPTEELGPVHSFFNDELFIGGFFEPGYEIIVGPNTSLQSAEVESLLGLNISATFSDQLHFSSQFLSGLNIHLSHERYDPLTSSIGFSNQRIMSGYVYGALIAQGYLEYRMSDHFLIQGGMGYVPFGYAYQQREPVLFERRGGPQMIRTSPLVSPLWAGFNLQGNYTLPSTAGAWGYNFYSYSPVENPQFPGLGARLWWASQNENLKLGTSTQIGKLGVITSEALGGDLEFKMKPFVLTSEYVHTFVHSNDDPWSVYIEPSLMIVREIVLVYVFADYADNPLNQPIFGAARPGMIEPYMKWEYGAGVNWLPTSYVRLRLGLTYNDYVGSNSRLNGQDRNYIGTDFSAGVTF